MSNNIIGCVLAYCNNYGSMLQSYATVKMIKSMGYDCEIIRYVKNDSIWKKLIKIYWLLRIGDCSDQLRKYKRMLSGLIHPKYKKNRMIKNRAFDRFGLKYLKPFFVEYVGYKNLERGAQRYDLVLVGSDQLWTPMSLYGNYYNLLFVGDDVPKVSYATSFGVSSIPSFQFAGTKKYLDRFSKIGVRELTGKKIVDSISVNKASVVADPTLLLKREDWETLAFESYMSIKTPYILCLFLGKNKASRRAVKLLREQSSLKIVAICHNDEYIPDDDTLGDETPYDVSPADFLYLVKHATYICTDSFHCTIFSVLFHKKFETFYRYLNTKKGGRNSRIDSLLEMLDLQDRIYDGDIMKIDNEIDYSKVDKKLSIFRDYSLQFLKEELTLSKSK